MKNEGKSSGVDSDLRTLVEAQRIRMDKARSEKPTNEDTMILAEAKRIQDDEDRSEAVRQLTREKKKNSRKADIFAIEGVTSGKLKSRREAMESGDVEDSIEFSRQSNEVSIK